MQRRLPPAFCAAVFVMTTLLTTAAFADSKARHKTITVGSLMIIADDVIAVVRSSEQQPVEVFIGKPGHAVQVILFRDLREAQAVFTDLWDNREVTKDPGDDDARPLTRMKLKDSARGPTTLIANLSRLLAIVHHPDSREIHIYIDQGAVAFPLPDLTNNDAERHFVEIKNNNGEADIVIAAYKECVGVK